VNQQTATLLFVLGIAGLFWLDRSGSGRPSKALWLPVIWLASNGSRPVSAWLGIDAPPEIAGQLPESSLLDQAVAAALMLWGVVVLTRRRREVTRLLRASWPIVVYFAYSLATLVFSDYPGWGAKRWVRGLGDVVMVLIVVTDAQPTTALRRLFSRVGFVLLPLSVLFIKYYPELGRGFSPWGDGIVNTGVTTNKNSLGALVFLISLGTLWQVLSLLRDKGQPRRTRRLLAQCTLLAFGIQLLFTAQSATSGASFAIGAALMLAFNIPGFRARPATVHAIVLSTLLFASLAQLLGAKDAALKAMGRKPDLTGRTEIWARALQMAPNAIVGAGFETFWCGPRVAEFYDMQGGTLRTNEAHNGYIEVYLNLGVLGLGVIALILGQGYSRSVSAFRRDSALGAMLLAYVVAAMAYSIGEAGFRILCLPWFFLLLSTATACRISCLAEPNRNRMVTAPPFPPETRVSSTSTPVGWSTAAPVARPLTFRDLSRAL
jgi:exopolysaccharide production protein ExoQ